MSSVANMGETCHDSAPRYDRGQRSLGSIDYAGFRCEYRLVKPWKKGGIPAAMGISSVKPGAAANPQTKTYMLGDDDGWALGDLLFQPGILCGGDRGVGWGKMEVDQ